MNDPSHPDVLLPQALSEQSAGRLDAARTLFDRVLAVVPEHNVALYHLALLVQSPAAGGLKVDPLPLLARCVASDVPAPPLAAHHAAYAASLGRAGRHEEAVAAADRALAVDPASAEALFAKGAALDKLARPDESLAALRAAAAADPHHAAALAALGAALLHRPSPADRAEAVRCLTEARRLLPSNVAVASDLGHALRHAGRTGEGVAAFRDAVRLRGDSPDTHNNLGVALQESGQLADAIACFRAALRVRPAYAEAHWNLALALLSRGDFDDGWLEYEWRRRLKPDDANQHRLPHPEWNGCSLAGRSILLRCEQGLGDTIQFVRYAALVKARGARRVVVECQPPLAALLRRAAAVDDVIARGEPIPIASIDLHARLMSLPGIFGTTPTTIPAHVPYLRPDAERVAFWREKLADYAGQRVGIAWQGSAAYANDFKRSMPLAYFEPLARVPGVRLFSLQKGPGSEQIAAARAPSAESPFVVHDFATPAPDDHSAGAFVDTAALVANLDLVVTSDTAVAHLAGALGAAVWVALPKEADWRWMRDRDDSPWYPTMRLFRQRQAGDWAGVFAQIAEALRERAGVASSESAARVMVPLAPGELIDRLTILQIKAERIADPAKLANVQAELAALRRVAGAHLPPDPRLDELTAELSDVNRALWDVEDALREHERSAVFDDAFMALARAVYHANDRRAALKREVNTLLGSDLTDEKSYAPYGHLAIETAG